MPFEYDIFISYGHLDDDDPDDDRGWVDLLVARLPGLVASHLGEKPRLWRDAQNLRGHHELEAAIKAGIERSLLFVPVFSPRYATSFWCRWELEQFCAAQPPTPQQSGDAYSTRIFKIIKSPLLLRHLSDKEPAPLKNLTGYAFYKIKEEMPHLFSPDVSNGKDQDYWDQLKRLAWHIAEKLAQLKYDPQTATQQTATQAATQTPPTETPSAINVADATNAANVTTPVAASASPAAPDTDAPSASPSSSVAAPSKFVYLAETATDLAAERERVHDELRLRGYGVLPAQKLPLEEAAKTEEAVRQDLAQCVIAVHLVGAKYGLTPEDDGRSVVRIQEELAAEHERANASFHRVLWTPAGIEVTDKRQREFVEGLQQRVTERTELLHSSVEDLKTRVVEKLNPPAAVSVVAVSSREARARLKYIYLICEQRDRPLVRAIRNHLVNEQKFEVITWFDEGEGAKLTESHRKYLTECDAALIYFGNGDEMWVRKNLEDLDKAYGYGREDDWAASAVYVGAPPKEEKEDFITNLVPVIRSVAEFKPEDLREFISAVKEADDEGGAA